MPIPAKRFEFLGTDTNVSPSDFLSMSESAIFNSVNNELLAITPQLAGFIKSSIGGSSLADFIPFSVPSIDVSGTTSTYRSTKDALGGLLDTSQLNSKQLDNLVGARMGDNRAAQAAYSQMPSYCKTSMLGYRNRGKPYNSNINCNGTSRPTRQGRCGTSQFNNILNKYTNGRYNSSVIDKNAILNNLIAMSKYGYDSNMCNVFSSLAEGVDTDILTRAAASLLSYVNLTGNIQGFFDLTKSTAGLPTLLEYPSGVEDSWSNFKTPLGTTERDYSGLYDQYSESLSSYNENWSYSEWDDSLSTAKAQGTSDSLNDILTSARTQSYLSPRNLDTVRDFDLDFFSVAL